MSIVDTLKNDLKNALSKGAFHLIMSMAFSQFIVFLLGIALARILGAEKLGHVRVIQAVLQFAAVPANLGMASAIAKYVSEFQSEELKNKVLSQGVLFNIFTALLVSFALFLLCQSTSVIRDGVARYYLQFMCWLLPFTTFTKNVLCDLQGRKRIKEMAVVSIASRSLSFVLVFSLTYLWMLRGYIVAMLGYGLTVSLALLWLIRGELVPDWGGDSFRKMLRFGGFAMFATIFSTITLTIDTLCISNILGNADLVGYYGVAITMARGVMVIPNAVSQTAFPYLSERSGDFSLVWKQLWRLSKRVGLVMGFICVTGFMLARWVIPLLFGREYLLSASVFRVLMPGIFIYSFVVVSGNTIVAIGRTDVSLYITLISGTLNVIMNIFLIRKFGLIGAALATISTYALNLAAQYAFWFRQLGEYRRHHPE